MHEAVDILEAAVITEDPTDVYSVTNKALASAMKVIARADDSSGIIGDACRRLLDPHPKAAVAAGVPAMSKIGSRGSRKRAHWGYEGIRCRPGTGKR